MIDRTSLVTVAPGIASTHLDGEVVLLDLSEGVYYGLDEIGARVWDMMQHPVRVADISTRLHREYHVSPVQCLEDVRALLRDMQTHRLISHVTGSSDAPGRQA